MRKIINNKLTATFAVTGILSLIPGIQLTRVGIFHTLPYLSREENWNEFLYWGGDWGIFFLLISLICIVITVLRAICR